MFKVLIVDDEPIIRKGLKNIIDWNSMECEICGEASDGKDGMNLIDEVKPDIVITDIKMPGVDGLSMIKETKNIIPDGKIVILTGFRDFEYIQEAIKLGAFDYLLKPSRIEDINSVLKKAVEELKSQRCKDEEFENLKNEFKSKIPVLRQKLLYDIMYKIIYKPQEIMEQLKLYELNIVSFILIIVETDEIENEKNKSQFEKQLYQFGIINAFEENFNDDFIVYNIALSNNKVVFIVQPKEENAEFGEIVYKNVNNLKEVINSCFDFTITVSISSVGKGALDIPEKAKEAEEALAYKFYMGKNSVILFQDLKSLYRPTDLSILESYEKALIQSIKAGNEKNTKAALDEIFACVSENFTDKENVKIIYWNLISSINSISLSSKVLDGKDDFYRAIQMCTDIGELNSLLSDIALKYVSRINSFNRKTINSTLEKAIEYIKLHYSESITLNEVAEYTYVSTYYLSRMFTKELGKNFVDYLNEIRIERAKEFLRQTDYKTYEIAEMVGVRDAHYFSKLFKKYTGMTPSEYKE